MGKVLFSQVSVYAHSGEGGAYLPADRGGGTYLAANGVTYLAANGGGGCGPTFQPMGEGGTYLPAGGGNYLPADG